jgi:leucyl aminopeptidase
MKKIDIFFINNSQVLESNPQILVNNLNQMIKINVFNLSNYSLVNLIGKINDLIRMFNQIKRVNVIFDVKITRPLVNKILTKLSDILYKYYPITQEIKLYQVENESINLMEELTKYKNIVMDPNKNPNTYLDYVKSNIPANYQIKVKTLSDDKIFPLTRGVGMGSNYPAYWVHVQPKPQIQSQTKQDIYLIGKAVTYDAGGLNIKLQMMDEMKIDMTGSAIILSVLRLLDSNNYASNINIHLFIPIVENMVSSKSIKPGSVIESMGGKKIEITNTDAEGRLCIVDCIEWINIYEKPKPNSLILDISTLTGNTQHITSGISSIIMSNDKANKYTNKLINIGEDIGEYLDYLKIRNEYMDMLKTPVADIKNINMEEKAGCVIGGTFISYFVNNEIPWIHIDLGVTTFVNSIPLSYGVNLLYEFIKWLDSKKIDNKIN